MSRKERLKRNLAVLLDFWQGCELVSKEYREQIAYRRCATALRAVLFDNGNTELRLGDLLRSLGADEADRIEHHVRQYRRLELARKALQHSQAREDGTESGSAET